jgi:hypothetical protein
VTVILAAIGATLIDHKYAAAAGWAGAGAVLTLAGLLHAYRLEGNLIHEFFLWQKAPEGAGVVGAYRALPVAAGYLLATALLVAVAIRERKRSVLPAVPPPAHTDST